MLLEICSLSNKQYIVILELFGTLFYHIAAAQHFMGLFCSAHWWKHESINSINVYLSVAITSESKAIAKLRRAKLLVSYMHSFTTCAHTPRFKLLFSFVYLLWSLSSCNEKALNKVLIILLNIQLKLGGIFLELQTNHFSFFNMQSIVSFQYDTSRVVCLCFQVLFSIVYTFCSNMSELN